MSATGLITLVFIGLIILNATSREVGANPAPAIDAVSPAKSAHTAEPSKASLEHPQEAQAMPDKYGAPTAKQQAKAANPAQLNGEKLRRGLSNFLNHLNPAPFFVPTAPQQLVGSKKQAAAAGSQAEPAAIINVDGSTANVLIKGPARLAAPLRWGRK